VQPTVETLTRPSGDALALHHYPDGGTGPLAVILPAMGVPARYYKPFAAELGAAGLAVTAVDLRGNGASTPTPARATRYGYADLADDIGAVRAALEARRAGRPLLLVGHSLGGQVGLIHAATEPGVSGIVLVAVGIPYWRAYPGRRKFGVLGMSQSIGAASALLGVWPGWGFGGRQAGRVMTDWARTARTGGYGAAADAGLARMTTPVLAVSVDGDTLVPRAVVDYLAGKLTAAPVEREHFTAADLGAPVNHFTWTRASGPIVARIQKFAAAP
jgi:predicted alpha/beta hydrolase